MAKERETPVAEETASVTEKVDKTPSGETVTFTTLRNPSHKDTLPKVDFDRLRADGLLKDVQVIE